MLDPEAREQPVEVVAAPLLALIMMERFDRAETAGVGADRRRARALGPDVADLLPRAAVAARHAPRPAALRVRRRTEALPPGRGRAADRARAALTGTARGGSRRRGPRGRLPGPRQTAIAVFEFVGAQASEMWPRAALGLLELVARSPRGGHPASSPSAREAGTSQRPGQPERRPVGRELRRGAGPHGPARRRHGGAPLAGGPGRLCAGRRRALERCRGLLAAGDAEADSHFESSAAGVRRRRYGLRGRPDAPVLG